MTAIAKHHSRREFLRHASRATALTGTAAPWLLNLSLAAPAAAQAASDYKALVCVFLGGGNDSFNTVLPTDAASWAQYTRWRATGAQPIALAAAGAAGGVLPIVPRSVQTGRSFALHPQLVDLVTMFNAGRLAIVPNIAPIKGPLDLRDFNTGVAPQLPPALFSHEHQASIWQSQSPNGGVGWAGRIGDLLAAGNGANTVFTSISTDGASGWGTGQSTVSYAASRNGGVKIELLGGTGAQERARADILRRIVSRDSNQLLEKDVAAVTRRSIAAEQTISSGVLARATATNANGVADPTLIAARSGTAMSENPLAVQLQTVARIIGAHAALGLKRQVFFVTLGAFDTHANQMVAHDYAMAQVNHALAYFDRVLATLGGQDMRSQVTTFTASEFGRTFTSNGTGTDHGLGGHHMVMGAAVRGKDIHGVFPMVGTGHERDMGKGILIPQFSVDQYGATLARWFGLSDTQLNDVFPNLPRFTQRDLGFMA